MREKIKILETLPLGGKCTACGMPAYFAIRCAIGGIGEFATDLLKASIDDIVFFIDENKT